MAGCLVLLGCADRASDVATAVPGTRLEALSEAERGRFLLGRALFERLATPEEGLGPLFNAERCSDCHDQPAVGGGGIAIPVLKATGFVEGRCSLLEDRGGDNLQRRATPAALAAGVGAEQVPEEATATALVVAPPLYGLGLLEAVSVAEVEAGADPQDADGDGVRGLVPRFADGRSARFGRKGDAASVRDFVESALRFELGFTTERHPVEEARNGVPIPDSLDPMPDPEMDDETLGLLTDYVRFLAPLAPEMPADRATADSIARGEGVFGEVGCAGCHTAVWVTSSEAPEEALRSRTIRPYSDLLLHDIGEGETDVCTPQARPGLYRTAPLWGLRYRTVYMHDGGAASLPEAIQRHRGEADGIRAAYERLDPVDQVYLLRFLASL